MKMEVGIFGGVLLDLNDPDPSLIKIKDIGWALAQNLRFNGHTSRPYSVAMHCIHMSEVVPDHLRKAAFLHDASEAYMGDLITPIKQHFPLYAEIEDRLIKVIFDMYGVPFEHLEAIGSWDRRCACAEAMELMGAPAWAAQAAPLDFLPIFPAAASWYVRQWYFARFTELFGVPVNFDNDPRYLAAPKIENWQ